jgi:hypothetical protein
MTMKLPQIQTFMVQEDEREFSKAIRNMLPGIVFADQLFLKNPSDLNIHDSISDCSSPIGVTLLNTQILSLEDFSRKYVLKNKWHDYYEVEPVGHGLIQYLRSQTCDFKHQGLSNGRLAASYDLEKQPEMDFYVKSVFKIFKKTAVKLYYLNPETWQINEKPETRFFAWPGAIKHYDGVDGKYLIGHAQAYFTSRRTLSASP